MNEVPFENWNARFVPSPCGWTIARPMSSVPSRPCWRRSAYFGKREALRSTALKKPASWSEKPVWRTEHSTKPCSCANAWTDGSSTSLGPPSRPWAYSAGRILRVRATRGTMHVNGSATVLPLLRTGTKTNP